MEEDSRVLVTQLMMDNISFKGLQYIKNVFNSHSRLNQVIFFWFMIPDPANIPRNIYREIHIF